MMKPNERTYLIAPFALLLALLAFDGLFRLPFLHERFSSWKRIEEPLYNARMLLLDELTASRDDLMRNNTPALLIFGTSRSGQFGSAGIRSQIPDALPFNFSAPLAGYSYHYFILEKIIERRIPVRGILIEADPVLLTGKSLDYPLAYSFDLSFMIRHLLYAHFFHSGSEIFSADELETYLLKRIFVLYRYPFDYGALTENTKEFPIMNAESGLIMTNGISFREKMIDSINRTTLLEPAGFPNPLPFASNEADRERDAKNRFVEYGFQNFHPRPSQIAALRSLLLASASAGIPVILFEPPVSPEFQRLLDGSGASRTFREIVDGIERDVRKEIPGADIRFVTPSEEMRCLKFADAIHLNGACFNELTRAILKD